MGLVRRFEDLTAWRQARELARAVYRASREGAFARDWGLRDQMCRAAVSTMNNTAEGFDSGSRTEFGRFLRYAARSASEVQSCLYVALDQNYVGEKQFQELYQQAERVRSLLRGLRRSLERDREAPSGDVVREDCSVWNPVDASSEVGVETEFVVSG